MQYVSRDRPGEIEKVKTVKEYTNSQMRGLIDEHIHNSKYRTILLLRFIDGLTYDRIAEEMRMSPQQVKTIVYRAQAKLLKYL